MSPSFLLCHGCFSWVLPRGGRCPVCRRRIDLSTPDPPLAALGERMGEVVAPIGSVRLFRRQLPKQGMLYATTTGLIFVPHEVRREPARANGSANERRGAARFCGDESPSRAWPTLFRAPLAVALSLVPSRPRSRKSAVLRPRLLEPGERRLLPRLLMDDPGTLFLPTESIRTVWKRFGRWTLERRDGASLQFKPERDARGFQDRLCRFATAHPTRAESAA